ncbi:hypothetical protein J2Y66_000847 [Paenarthrobacter nitroguajacolicus]|nr:hypothetical protein [Paenarthrobacter nitroguajacolicus]
MNYAGDEGENFVRRTVVSGPEKFVMGITTGKYEISLGGNTRCVPDSEKKRLYFAVGEGLGLEGAP